MIIGKKLGFSIGIALALTGCAPQHSANQENLSSASPSGTNQNTISAPVTETTQKTAEQVKLNSATLPTTWDLSGAIAARSGNKAWTASLNWLQSGPNAYQIRLSGPLGSGSILVQKKGNTIYFKDGAKTDFSSNANQLLQKHTGISLPVSSLYYWVRGIPAPGDVQNAKRDANNHLLHLQQAGYSIDYLGYTQVGNISLPRQIRLQGNGVLIKLVINGWKI